MVYGILVAAGKSRRMEPHGDKLWINIEGRSVFEWALLNFSASDLVPAGVVVVQAHKKDVVQDLIEQYGLSQWHVMVGGTERVDSVRQGLKTLQERSTHPTDVVLVHDAARFMVPRLVIEQVIEATTRYGAAIPGQAVVDTVKRGGSGVVEATVARQELVLAQTPQGSRIDWLTQAYAQWSWEHGVVPTDESQLLEQSGRTVHIVEGHMLNKKLTIPSDIGWFSYAIKELL